MCVLVRMYVSVCMFMCVCVCVCCMVKFKFFKYYLMKVLLDDGAMIFTICADILRPFSKTLTRLELCVAQNGIILLHVFSHH